jgi:hypothetical protein
MTSKLMVPLWKRAAVGASLLSSVLFATLCFGQQLTGTLTGTVLDSTGAVVPSANVSMKNMASGDTRTTVSNSSGYFSITAVQPGTYSISVSASGFKSWQESGIVFAQGDNRNLPNIKLQVGQVNETVEISANSLTVPTDNAEVSTTIHTDLIENIPIVGRDVGEMLKLMPGAASTNGLTQGSSFSDKVVGTNSGPVGAYSLNGTQPYGSMAYMLDGANLVDPGNAGTQIANINQDMVSEVKVLTSSYSAEYAKGPVIFQAFSKSGGNQYHGEGYLYTRNAAENSWDSYSSGQFTSFQHTINPATGKLPTAAEIAAKGQTLHGDESYYYIGGNVGGPIPFLNHGRKKLFFWGGYEYMRQHPAGQAINYNVPTLAQKGTDPSNPAGQLVYDESAVPSGVFGPWGYAYQHPKYNLPTGSQTYLANGTPAVVGTSCDGTNLPNCTKTTIPASAIDPNIAGVLKLYPDPNSTPSSDNGWNNYTIALNVPQNRWEATGKVDYAISDNTKLSVSYTRQLETDQHPIAIWWAPAWTLPYPSPIQAKTSSQEVMANLTHVFSPTTTNEFVFTLARYINPSTLTNPKAVDRTALGFNVPGLFGHTTKQIPQFLAPWGGSFPDIRQFSFDGSFNGGAFGGLKKDPAIYDNFTKVIGSHTLKFGAYWDTSENVQSSSANDNGTFNGGWANIGTNNVVADFLLGKVANYQQASAIPVDDIKFHQWSVYAQDSFKANRRLTLNYGLRFDHVGQWAGVPKGIQVWDRASYVNGTPLSPITANNTGLLYHAIDSKIPLSGYKSPLFYYEPRLGVAYDVFGTGRTVVRGGFAVFHYQISIQVCNNNTCDGPAGTVNYTTPTSVAGYANIAGFTPPSASFENGSTIGALQQGDNRTPYTMDWNVSVAQALPWRSVFELSYVANQSKDEFINGANGKINDINNVPVGYFFKPDPVLTAQNGGTSVFVSPNAPNGSGYPAFNAQHFRPMTNYQDVYLMTHGSYANYNSLQASWQKQAGSVNFLINYTFSKVLGIRDGQTDNGPGNGPVVDPFVLRNNYGPLDYDHTQILNLSYVWNMPKFVHGNKFLEGGINGWQFSGYTTYQAGAPLQPNLNGNLNAQWPGGLPVGSEITMPNGLLSNAVNPATWFGTNAINNLLPVVTCNPKVHAAGAFFNPTCFAPPAYGQQGTLNWPYLRGPAYFDSDLALFKNFQISERQKLQLRVSAVNFLNHPLRQFGLAGNGDQQLSFVNSDGTLSQNNTNPTTTGKPAFTTGSRTMTFAVKYYF